MPHTDDLCRELRRAADWASRKDAELLLRAVECLETLQAQNDGRLPRTPLADEFERRAWNEFLSDPVNPCWAQETYGMRADRYRAERTA